MKNLAIILGAKTYDFENSNKEKVSGAKITYISSVKGVDSRNVGYNPIQISVSMEQYNKLLAVPGLYEVQYSVVPGKNNTPTMQVSGFDYIQDVLLDPLFLESKK